MNFKLYRAESISCPPMELENRPPAEGINAEPERLGADALWLVLGTLGLLVALVLGLHYGATWLAPQVPFKHEVALAEQLWGPSPDASRPEAEQAANKALQALADSLRAPLGIPPDMPISVRVDDNKAINAYATLGGRVVIFKGLLAHLQREDELAALLAHEMAHVKHRHVAASMGRGVGIALVLSIVSASAGSEVASGALGQTTGLLLQGYSREQEAQADADATRAVAERYGHVQGVLRLFAVLEAQAPSTPNAPQWLRSHPHTHNRQATAAAWAQAQGVAVKGEAVGVAQAVRAWVGP
ncbi:MAG: M48 family metallopeptidase [Ideonella sp.]|nr:M48 family metallopeptidase [Ideonella sp.]